MILYRSHLADDIKHRHTHDSHSKEDIEHILLAHLFLDGRNQWHKDEGWQRAQTHEERHLRIGTPADTQSPPTFAMNIRTEVRMVISSVSRVSEEFKAP